MEDEAKSEEIIRGTTRTTLRKIWFGVAISNFLFCYLAMSAVQGEVVKLSVSAPVKLELAAGRPDAVNAMVGIFVIGALILLSSAVMAEHAGRGGVNWLERYPFRLMDASPREGVGKLGQWLACAFLTLGPIWVLAHLWRVFAHEGTLCHDVGGETPWRPLVAAAKGFEVWRRWFVLPEDAAFAKVFFDGYRLAGESAVADGCKNAVTFFPVVEPILMAVLSSAAIMTAGWGLCGVDPVWWTPLSSDSEVSHAALPSRLSA